MDTGEACQACYLTDHGIYAVFDWLWVKGLLK